VTDADPLDFDVPLSHLRPQEKAARAGSFGEAASHYERYRPGPPAAAVDWILPTKVGTVVDLGAGTGALTRLLIGRAEEVIAIEPDDRMRSVLTAQVPGVRALMGRALVLTLLNQQITAYTEYWPFVLGTILIVLLFLFPGGILGALWSGPDPEGPFVVQAQALLAEQSRAGAGVAAADERDPRESGVAGLIMGDARRPLPSLEIPPGVPFDQPEHEVFTWDVALDADELIGLLGTFSWIITMPEETRHRVIAEARRLLRDLLSVEGEVTVDVAFRADAWRSRRKEPA